MPLERDAIVAALRDAGGDIGKAARALGASRRTLQNRMREYGMPYGKAGRRKRLLPYGRRMSPLMSKLSVAAAAVTGIVLLGRYANRKTGA